MLIPLAIIGGSLALVLFSANQKKSAPEPTSPAQPSDGGTCVVQVPPVKFSQLVVDFYANAKFAVAAGSQAAINAGKPTQSQPPGNVLAVDVPKKLSPVPQGAAELAKIKGCQTDLMLAPVQQNGKDLPPQLVSVVFNMPNGINDFKAFGLISDTNEMVLPIMYAGADSAGQGKLTMQKVPQSGQAPDARPLRAYIL